MKKMSVLIIMTTIGIVGCAGVKITPISRGQAVGAHNDLSGMSGYIVYEPVVLVEVSKKEVCLEKDDKGNCKKQETRCAAGAPFILPDYSKPYLVDIVSGFGKSGADITISDGWRLGNVKDSSDNTAVLGTVEKLLGIKAAAFAGDQGTEECKSPGLYRVSISEKGIVLVNVLTY